MSTSADGVLVAGQSTLDGAMAAEAVFVPDNGSAGWSLRLAGFPESRFRALAPLASGWALAGEMDAGAGSEALLVRIDESGDTLWTRRYQQQAATAFHALGLSADGTLLAGGRRGHEVLLARLDLQGDTIWTVSHELVDGYSNFFADLVELPDGRIAACGQAYLDWHEWIHREGLIVIFTAEGGVQHFAETYDSRMKALVLLPDGRLASSGEYQAAYLPLWFFNDSLELVHYEQFGSAAQNMRAFDVGLDTEGQILICGRHQTAPGNTDAFLMRLDDQGNEEWLGDYEVCQMDAAEALATREGGYHLAGSCQPSNSAFLQSLEWSQGLGLDSDRTPVVLQLQVSGSTLSWVDGSGTSTIQTLRLYNLQGQLLLGVEGHGTEGRLLLPAGLPVGRYILQARRLDGSQLSTVFSYRP